ncbi:hypothetical protein HELRODRAFT_70921 [Helobdella robusta]|uniref:Kinesin-associated protein 3 n=1 Tax=Helobdella robusta TaxID=6412 RepID=T1G0E3_HELRO|nr:hypothetical protein HELRODRAFT_70921 [Helobdella robusta]ESN90663.1 hypothetical protein HELRODRAFT_70921 [Helobdella robusta]
MNAEDARYLKRRITAGSIDVHPVEKALVVNYEVEAVILSESGEPVLGDKKQCQKVVKVGAMGENTDIKLMAKNIIDKCKLIHPSKQPEIEQLLYYLQKRKVSSSTSNSAGGRGHQQKIKHSHQNSLDNLTSLGNMQITELANINDLEMYLEMLYDEISERLRGTHLILQLALKPENLDELCQNEILLGALSRVLAEDWKNSTELATNIVHIFFCFSRFSQLHAVVSHFQVGSLCMKIIEHELNLYDGWMDQMKKTIKKDLVKSAQKQLQQLTAMQERLLQVSFHMLLNLAEDRKLEAKMHKKGIVKMLVRTLERKNNVELLRLVISFLKKLSIFVENKDNMVKLNTVESLASILAGSKNEDLINVSLRLLLNLSFDGSIRHQIFQNDMLKMLMDLLKSDLNRPIVLCLLYNLTVNKRNCLHFVESDCCQVLMKLLMAEKERNKFEIETLGLCVNLASNPTCADVLSDPKLVQFLMKRTVKNRDPLTAKLLKKLSYHLKFSPDEDKKPDKEGTAKKIFLDYVGDIGSNVKNAFRDEFSAECLSILANMKDPELDFEMVLKEYKLIEWLKENLKPASLFSNDDEIVFQMVRLISTSCLDETCASALADSGIVQSLISLLTIKQEEDVMVIQIVYIFYQLIQHEKTKEYVILKTQAPAYLIDLMHDGNEQIRKICSGALDIVSNHDQAWSKKIKLEKFRIHNQQWIEMIKMQQQHQQQQPGSDLNDYLTYPHHTSHRGFGNGLNYSHDSFLGGYIEDASVLEGAEFYYGDMNPDYMPGDGLSIYSDIYGSMKGHERLYNDLDISPYERPPSSLNFGVKEKSLGHKGYGNDAGGGDEDFDDQLFGSSYYLGAMGYGGGR